MKKITADNYKNDKYYYEAEKAFTKVLAKSDVVATVEVLIEAKILSRTDYEVWRLGRSAFLEKMMAGNLAKANRIMKIIAFHAKELEMLSNTNFYNMWGNDRKELLQFSKSANKRIEDAYSTHYLWNLSDEAKQLYLDGVLGDNSNDRG